MYYFHFALEDFFTKFEFMQELWAGVEFFVDKSEAVAVNVGVNLSSGNIDMAEHFLDASKVGAASKQMGCETMAKGVGGKVTIEAGAGGVFFDKSPDFDTAETAASAGEKQKIRWRFISRH